MKWIHNNILTIKPYAQQLLYGIDFGDFDLEFLMTSVINESLIMEYGFMDNARDSMRQLVAAVPEHVRKASVEEKRIEDNALPELPEERKAIVKEKYTEYNAMAAFPVQRKPTMKERCVADNAMAALSEQLQRVVKEKSVADNGMTVLSEHRQTTVNKKSVADNGMTVLVE